MFSATSITKSYAFIDIIGVKKGLLNGSALKLLDTAWKAADNWASMQSSKLVDKINSQGAISKIRPEVMVSTIGDSIFITTKEEYTIESFYVIIDSFRDYLIKQEIKFYTIVNRDDEVYPHIYPPTGAREYNYFNVTGAGKAWGNIYLFDKEFEDKENKTLESWKNKYKYYVIGEKNLLSRHKILESYQFEGIGREFVTVSALE